MGWVHRTHMQRVVAVRMRTFKAWPRANETFQRLPRRLPTGTSGCLPRATGNLNPPFLISSHRIMAHKHSITDIDGDIATQPSAQNLLSLLPRSHSGHIIGVYSLAMARFACYKLSQKKEDLEKSILHYTEAILIPPVSRDGRLSLNIVELLFYLAGALLCRSENFKQSEDVKYSIEYLRYLRGLPLESFDISRNTVAASLIRALDIQVASESEAARLGMRHTM
ncbi:hypothetical protein EDB89DRAFT_410142 [Lactarius sanguifluus]|nr:hypothetical protein EDB89DRAFT_410142 [Lactarius sanguifluus]